MYEKDLIYDVGVYNGDDTAYYLHKGYRVVAIEAHPKWAQDARERFADAIRDGRLTILNVAIGPEEGVAELVVNERHTDWTTLNTDLTKSQGWAGMATHVMEIRTVRFKDVLAEHGVPYYLKVDIETFDHYCLEDLDPSDLPPYVSFEAQYFRDLVMMRDKGYQVFKVIRQQDHRQAHFDPAHYKAAHEGPVREGKAGGKRPMSGWTPALLRTLGLSGQTTSPETAPVPQIIRYQPDADWPFPGGSAGPFGEASEGCWRSFEQAAMTWLAYESGLVGPDWPGEGRWHDIHCRAPIADFD